MVMYVPQKLLEMNGKVNVKPVMPCSAATGTLTLFLQYVATPE